MALVWLPMALGLVAVAWLLLTRSLGTADLSMPQNESVDTSEGQALGPISSHERRVLGVFVVTALAWITRKEPFGGWSELLGITTMGDDSVALAAALAFFIIPTGSGSTQRLLDWETAKGIPWGLLILFGGGIAIAKAFAASGLSNIIGSLLTPLATSPFFVATLLICLVVTFLTEVTSNTATTTLLMPILAAAAIASDIDPLLLMIPAALSASCAFMLPVATAPNAVVYGSGMLPVAVMARTGVRLNLLAVIVITLGLTLRFRHFRKHDRIERCHDTAQYALLKVPSRFSSWRSLFQVDSLSGGFSLSIFTISRSIASSASVVPNSALKPTTMASGSHAIPSSWTG